MAAPAGSGSDWQALLDSGSAPKQQQGCQQALRLMKTLLEASRASGDAAAIRALAKEHGSSVMQLIKAMSARLVVQQPPLALELAEQFADVACAALEGLEALRTVLKGSKQLELEKQGYAFVRRFVALGLHAHALRQAWSLHRLLLPSSGAPDEGKSQDLRDLQAGAICSLMVSLAEALSWPTTDGRLARLLPDPQQMLLAAAAAAQATMLSPSEPWRAANEAEAKHLQLLHSYGLKVISEGSRAG
jgi:hypothetical protein